MDRALVILSEGYLLRLITPVLLIPPIIIALNLEVLNLQEAVAAVAVHHQAVAAAEVAMHL